MGFLAAADNKMKTGRGIKAFMPLMDVYPSGMTGVATLPNCVSPRHTASKRASRTIFVPNCRPKILLPAPFSLSGTAIREFINRLLGEIVDETTNCVFCRILKGEIPSTKVYEDEGNLVFRDINPAAPTHLLVIPKRHVARLSECGEADRELLAGLMLTASKAAKIENLDSFRLIINDGAGAGQTVFHLHAHVLGGRVLTEKLL